MTPAEQPLNGMPWLGHHDEFTPSASPSGLSVTPPPSDFDQHVDPSLAYASAMQSQQGISWTAQEVSIVHQDTMDTTSFHPQIDFVDPSAHIQDYYGVEQYGAAVPTVNCGIQSGSEFAFQELTYNPAEIHNY
jgi:hypothetical protein